MARVIWAEPALNDLDTIADYIALHNPTAASELVRRIFSHVDQLILHPDSGSKPRELRAGRYRQIVDAYSGEDDRLFRRNVTGDSGEVAL